VAIVCPVPVSGIKPVASVVCLMGYSLWEPSCHAQWLPSLWKGPYTREPRPLVTATISCQRRAVPPGKRLTQLQLSCLGDAIWGTGDFPADCCPKSSFRS
jgi:hypothetical protein